MMMSLRAMMDKKEFTKRGGKGYLVTVEGMGGLTPADITRMPHGLRALEKYDEEKKNESNKRQKRHRASVGAKNREIGKGHIFGNGRLRSSHSCIKS